MNYFYRFLKFHSSYTSKRKVLLLIILILILLIKIKPRLFEIDAVKKSLFKNVHSIKQNSGDENFEKFANTHKNPKIHISYVHFLHTVDMVTVDNFKFFMNFAYEPCHLDADFTIIINYEKSFSKTSTSDLDKLISSTFSNKSDWEKFKDCQNGLNPSRNTFIIMRENKDGGDLCAHADFLKMEFWLENKASYAYYFFINSSSRGPFLPNYWTQKWWLIFVDMFARDSNVVAVGPFISCEFFKHIQSFFIALDRRGVDVLEKTWRCPFANEKRFDWIMETEVVNYHFYEN